MKLSNNTLFEERVLIGNSSKEQIENYSPIHMGRVILFKGSTLAFWSAYSILSVLIGLK